MEVPGGDSKATIRVIGDAQSHALVERAEGVELGLGEDLPGQVAQAGQQGPYVLGVDLLTFCLGDLGFDLRDLGRQSRQPVPDDDRLHAP